MWTVLYQCQCPGFDNILCLVRHHPCRGKLGEETSALQLLGSPKPFLRSTFFFFFFFLASPPGLWNLNSQTRPIAVKAPSHNHWTTKEFSKGVLNHFIIKISFKLSLLEVVQMFIVCFLHWSISLWFKEENLLKIMEILNFSGKYFRFKLSLKPALTIYFNVQ